MKKEKKIIKEKGKDSDSEENKNLKFKEAKYELTIILNLEKKTLQFLRNNELKGEYTNISLEKSLTPAVFLYNENDTIEIEGFD